MTGANTGLGYETTRDLAQKGMKVVMACRSEDRALPAKARIEADVPGADLEFMGLDLGALSSVRAFASAFRTGHERLDLLINNAGVMWIPYEKSVDGFEGHMAANYFGHFLLTSLLMDEMPDGPASRVVTLSSIAHRQPPKRIRFEDLNWERGYNKYRRTRRRSWRACCSRRSSRGDWSAREDGCSPWPRIPGCPRRS